MTALSKCLLLLSPFLLFAFFFFCQATISWTLAKHCVFRALLLFFYPSTRIGPTVPSSPPSGCPFVSPSLLFSYNPSHLLPSSLPLIETRSSHHSHTMSSDFKSLTVKKYPRLPGRKTSESRYWRKFKVQDRIHVQLLHSILN